MFLQLRDRAPGLQEDDVGREDQPADDCALQPALREIIIAEPSAENPQHHRLPRKPAERNDERPDHQHAAVARVIGDDVRVPQLRQD